MATDEKRQFSLLLVDDEPAILSALKRAFRKAPYTIHTAENGLQAIEVLEQTHVDAALVDLMMPEKDGAQATAELRKLGFKMPVIAMTGKINQDNKAQAISIGMDDYIIKPVSIQTIKRVLITYFSESIN